MSSRTFRLTVAGLLLLSGVSVAIAAGNDKSSSTTGSMSSSASQSMAKDTLSLPSTQQKTAWKDISAQATKQKAPADFVAQVGDKIPSGLTTHPVPVSTASKVPDLRDYQYALLDNNKLLIVNPQDKKIAEVILQ
jgi:hypothetical protein